MASSSETHISTGIRSVLAHPAIYNLFHNITGGNKFRKTYFTKYFSLSPGSKVLDIGCGSGVMLDFIREDLDYHGIDFEPAYIDFCKEKFGDRGQFFLEKADENWRDEWEGNFDAINAHGLLHHLSDEEGEKLIRMSNYYLKPGGYLVTFDTSYHDNQSAISKWLVSKDRGQNVKHNTEYHKLGEKHFNTVEGTLFTNYSRLPYSAYAMKMIKA